MPSQEDYLDNLLKDMKKEDVLNPDEVTEEATELEIAELADLTEAARVAETFDWDDDLQEEVEETDSEEAGFAEVESDAPLSEDTEVEEPELEEPELDEPNEDSVYLDAVSRMTEEDIERLLAFGNDSILDKVDGADEADSEVSDDDLLPDVEELLQGSDDSELQEIQELFQKAENDEVIDEDVQSLFFGIGAEEESPADKLMAEIESGEDAVEEPMLARRKDKARKKEERAIKNAEKKAAKKAAKEAAKAERQAARQEKEAAKTTKQKADELDTDALDSIVFGAGNLGTEADVSEVSDTAGILTEEAIEAEFADLFSDVTSVDEAEDAVVVDDGLGIDLESLFGLSSEDNTGLFGAENDSGAEAPAEVIPEKKTKEKGTKEKKGIFAKLVDFLTEEEEEEPKNENIHLSAENEEIIRDLDKQKGKKKIKKKGKAAEKDAEEKPKRKAKAAKPKKEKNPKKEKIVVDDSYFDTQKKLTFKKVLPVILLGVTIGVVIMIISNVTIDVIDKKEAKEAFYNGDYYTCFENLYGKELDETEEVMYGKSESILYIRLWYREYEMFAEEGQEVEALDSLIQTVEDYPMLYEYASQWNATQEVYEVYSKILAILSEKYGLSEVQAIEIADIKSDKEYSKVVTIIANGGTYGTYGGSVDTQQPEADELPDELPEESGMNQGGFIDNR